MIEALRGLGYSTATAIADIVDNSIAAGARNVDLKFSWEGTGSYITIQDDGRGMNEAELDHAMRLGQQSPLDARADSDLGRFGLGLKTASFSQCRRLTVASKRPGQLGCLRWDLDVLAHSPDDEWHLMEVPADGSRHLLASLLTVQQGTLVLWEKLDRVVTVGFSEQSFLDLIDIVERHLGMVFHRYVDGPSQRLRITINRREIALWDPFLASHPATWSSPVDTIA
ncbi:MAG: ATP-binding protein, partial [Acidobacteriia bacterium]|nr:ATP-binding protein [Terriglobia bacterium]